MWVELTEAEQRLARYLALARHKYARGNGITDQKIGPQSAEDTDLEGIGAELAFCKLFNVYPDLQIGQRLDHDAILRTGEKVDVKATKYQKGHLLAARGKVDKPPDEYALMVGLFPRYRFAGFISAEELLRDERLKDFGHGPGYAASQDDLRKPEN